MLGPWFKEIPLKVPLVTGKYLSCGKASGKGWIKFGIVVLELVKKNIFGGVKLTLQN